MMDKSESINSELHPFAYQVAGHSTKSITGNIGILKHKDGYILKPINKSPQGDVEISFYERLNNDKELLPLKEFTPKYFGSLYLKINNMDIRFLKLKDVTSDFSKPCVMDVKIGKQTWDPNASIEKRRAEDAKYIECKREYGFCIPGYVVFNTSVGQLERFGKEDGKKLRKEAALDAFKHFLNYPSGQSSQIIGHIVKKLNELLNWWNIQKLVHIFSSSVLLTYDASKLEDLVANPRAVSEEDINNWVKIYTIDFAHVFSAHGEKDNNYSSGLSKLIEILELLL